MCLGVLFVKSFIFIDLINCLGFELGFVGFMLWFWCKVGMEEGNSILGDYLCVNIVLLLMIVCRIWLEKWVFLNGEFLDCEWMVFFFRI